MRENLPPPAVDGSATIGPPSFDKRGPAHEVHLAAHAREDAMAHRVGADLAGEIDLDARS